MSDDSVTTPDVTTPDDSAPTTGVELSVPEMRAWLRNWVANATGQQPDSISESTPMVELGLSSRDAVAMASDIEDMTGVTLTATVAFRHPTIEALAQVILTGASDIPLDIFAITRFSQEFGEAELIDACVDAYAHHYSEDYAALVD